MGKPKVIILGNTYPAKDKGAIIDTYITTTPTQQYIEFAKITINDTNDQWCLDQTLKKARELGADAIIITGKASSETVGIPIGNYSTYLINKQYGMTAIAIKYK